MSLITSMTNVMLQDRAPGGRWYCFDDTHVDPWDHAKLAVECFGGKYTPEGVTQVSHSQLAARQG